MKKYIEDFTIQSADDGLVDLLKNWFGLMSPINLWRQPMLRWHRMRIEKQGP